MQTVRIPLASFCEAMDGDPGALDPAALTAIRLRLEDPGVRRHVLIDSVEFTRDPAAIGTSPCPQTQHDWNCEATETLVASETSCAGEPTPDCDSGDAVNTPVALPTVAAGAGFDAFDGWVVHTPRGWVADPENPTEDEIDDIVSLCAAACELEWSDEPFIAANCSAATAFDTPTLRATPGRAAVHRIPAGSEDGSGLFTAQSLSCNLAGDCCEAFDEGLCAARPTRFTSARRPLNRGEEFLLDLSGAMTVDSTFANEPVSASLAGSVGYSECTEGNHEGPCAFYLGSLQLESDGLVVRARTLLDNLSINLVQPAFGMAEEDTDWKAFPPGALLLDVQGEVDSMPFRAIAPNGAPLYMFGSAGWIQVQGADGPWVELDIPCGALSPRLTV